MNELLQVGGKFGDYTVVRKLGEGGMGQVYLIRGDASGTEYAVKLLDPKGEQEDPELKQRFILEAELAMNVRHENLITVYDVGRDPDTHVAYIIMDYVPGGSVRDRLQKWGALPIEESCDIVCRVARALEVVDANHIVHRDIKPDNIMFTADGVTPKLADLGIARRTSSADITAASSVTSLTESSESEYMIGSPAYMSPEQMINSHSVDIRADIHALGVTFWEMLAGRRPYEGEDTMALVARAMKGQPIPDVRTARPEVPPVVAALIARMCCPDVEKRIQKPSQVVAELERFISGKAGNKLVLKKSAVAGSPRSVPAASAGIDREAERLRKIFLVALVGVLGVIGLATFVYTATRPTPPPAPVLVPTEPTEPTVPEHTPGFDEVPEPALDSKVEEKDSADAPQSPPQAAEDAPVVAPRPKARPAVASPKPVAVAPAAEGGRAEAEGPAPSADNGFCAAELRRYAELARQDNEEAIVHAVNAARKLDPDLRRWDFDGEESVPVSAADSEVDEGAAPAPEAESLERASRTVYREGKLFLMLELLRAERATLVDDYEREYGKWMERRDAGHVFDVVDFAEVLGAAVERDLNGFFRSFGVNCSR